MGKGVPAWESCTGTWLVSPAAGCEKKKMEVSTTGPLITKLSTLEHFLYILGLVGIVTGNPWVLCVSVVHQESVVLVSCFFAFSCVLEFYKMRKLKT